MIYKQLKTNIPDSCKTKILEHQFNESAFNEYILLSDSYFDVCYDVMNIDIANTHKTCCLKMFILMRNSEIAYGSDSLKTLNHLQFELITNLIIQDNLPEFCAIDDKRFLKIKYSLMLFRHVLSLQP